jgi:ATP-binding protein involved in chromosome partitioning
MLMGLLARFVSPRGTSSAGVTPDAVRAALAEVPYPGLSRDLVSFGMVRHVAACDGRVKVELGLRTADPSVPARLRAAVVERLTALGAATVEVVIREPEPAALPVPPAAAGAQRRDPWADQVRLGRVRHVVAVGAGKGGVGKSTVAANLALALAAEGVRAGLLDADIYGPSLPILLGIEDGAARARMTPERHIVPLAAHGLPLVSFGFFLGEGSPAVWRGPMVSKAVKQFATGVDWPELDVLVVDLPPGTGDVPLSLAQALALDGAVVVSQPARLAAVEAEKAVALFRALDVPVLGIVENMVGAFGRGAGRDAAASLGVPFLGEVPFDHLVVVEGDAGTPTVAIRPDGPAARAFVAIARRVAESLGWRHVAVPRTVPDPPPAPRPAA